MDQPISASRQDYDVIVIGGGFAGGMISRQLATSGLQVLVLERGELLHGSSGACAGRVQLIESHPGDYFDLVCRGYNNLPELGDKLEVDLEWFTPNHITLFTSPDSQDKFQPRVDMMRQAGFGAENLTAVELAELEPELDTDRISGAVLSQEGHLNPFRLGQGLFRQAAASGAEVRAGIEVTGFSHQNGRISGVWAGSEQFKAEVVVICGGAWTRELANLAGGSAALEFTRAEALVTEPIPPCLNHHIGLEGFFDTVHGSGQGIKLGAGQHPNGTLVISNAITSPPEISQHSTAWGLPALAAEFLAFFPGFNPVRVVRSWAAPSPYTRDQRPIIGWDQKISNLYLAAGFFLALPTIPVLAAAAAGEISSGNPDPVLEPFRPARFGKEAA